MTYTSFWAGRGFPWEHDPGPARNMSWARIFSETPNHRALSETYMNADKFRWHFGPMYYRGRLKRNQVKVLVIGQEGAMDESLAHRAFVGFSGGFIQNLLHYIGIDYHYLFLNTFVYPIHGQYTEKKIKILGQHTSSPLVIHRHKILNYALSKNDIRLIIAVGNAAKETVKTWIESHGGLCPNGIADLTSAESHVLGPATKAIGMIHPGALQQPSNATSVLADCQNLLAQIANWIFQDPGWLSVDPGMSRDFTIPFELGAKPIPFRDLPVGISWRIGNGNSTSKRLDNQRSIQLFAQIPSGLGHTPQYSGLSFGTAEGYEESTNDVPYEPPVDDHMDYDNGPTKSFLKMVLGGYPGLEWPDFQVLGITSHQSFGWMTLFRGRPQKAHFLILADQHSTDDLFSMRALTGNGGQRLQSFLQAAGIIQSYCVLRSLPVDTSGLSLNERKKVVADGQVVKIYKAIVAKILNYGETGVILVIGPVAQHLWSHLAVQTSISVLKMKSWNQTGKLTDWQTALQSLSGLSYTQDQAANFVFNGERSQIPRLDLPYGMLRWQGSSGNRVQRAKDKHGHYSPYYYKWFVPDWVFRSKSKPLSQDEDDFLNSLPQ